MRWKTFVEITRLEQGVFGLPFIFAGGILAYLQEERTGGWLWVVPAFGAARLAGMAFNQLFDRKFDAQNPRTQNRALPAGRIQPWQVACLGWGAWAAFLFFCLCISWSCLGWGVCAATLLLVYSYMKRFHSSAHFVLGAIHFLGPVMAHIAVGGKGSPAIYLLGSAAWALVSGNDILYAMQDALFDKEVGLHSLPARYGVAFSQKIAGGLHGICLGAVGGVGYMAHFSWPYYGVLFVLGGLFFSFHRALHRHWRAHRAWLGIEPLFFKVTALASLSVSLAVLGGVLCRVM